MAWNFILADRNGNTIDVLDTAIRQAQFDLTRSDVGKCVIEIDVDDDRAISLITQVAGATPRLYAYRDAALRWAGFLTSVEQAADNEAVVTATFEDALALLRYRITDADIEWYEKNSASIIASTSTVGAYRSLLSQANYESATGLVAGTVTATTAEVAELQISREVVLDRVLELSRITGGPDLRVSPQPQGATLATLDVGPLFTSQTPTLAFAYGPGTPANVLSVLQQITPPSTRVLVIGNDAQSWSTVTSDVTNAEAGVGRWEKVEQRSDLQTEVDCRNAADALVRTGWTQTITFAPDPAAAPVPIVDYNPGDAISVTAIRGSILSEATARVNKISFTVDNSGVEVNHQVEVEVGTAPVTAPAVKGTTNTATNTDAPLTTSTAAVTTAVATRLFRK
jgi:hypothetical protein